MYIWQIKPLRQQLVTEGLSQKQAYHYYLATLVFNALLFEAVSLNPAGSDFQPIALLDTSLYLLCVIGGVIWCFRQNGGASGKDFLPRLISISWVMFWRLTSLVTPFFALVGVISYVETGVFGRPGADMAIMMIVMNALYAGMWWRIGAHMHWVAKNSA